MDKKIKLSASLICCNFFNLKRDIDIFLQEGLDYIHFDIMDGHFVPRIGLGTFFLDQLTKKQKIPVEVHLMVSDPLKYIEEIANSGVSMITFHYEVGEDLYRIIQKIKEYDEIKIGLALRPYTPINFIIPLIDYLDSVLLMAYSPGTNSQRPFVNFDKRIKELNEILIQYNKENTDVAVDGGISIDNIKRFKENGAIFFIFGNSVLSVKGKKVNEQINLIKNILNNK